MNNSDLRRVLSRLSNDEFFDREAELDKLYLLATGRARREIASPRDAAESPLATRQGARPRRARNALLLGPPRVGKSELLRKCFDLLFSEGGEVAPVYYAFKPYPLEPDRFALDFLSQFLAQLIAFRRADPRLVGAADEPLATIARAAPSEDYLWVRAVVDSFSRAVAAGDMALVVRTALFAPAVAAANAHLSPFVMIDNFHLLAGDATTGQGRWGASPDELMAEAIDAGRAKSPVAELRSEFLRALAADGPPAQAGVAPAVAPAYLLCGLRRMMVDLIPPDEALFSRLDLIRLEAMSEEPLERMIRATARELGVDISDSTTELMIQQLNRDLFYIRALLDGAASRGTALKTFMEFERVYTEEVLGGRISHYLGALLRDLAPDPRARRAAFEALGLVVDSGVAVPIDALTERMSEHVTDADALLARLHARELLEINYGFVNASDDPVLADFARAKYRSEIAGGQRPVAGEQLLGEKLKHSYRLMMSRYNRAVESQLVALLSRFDFQGLPATLFDQSAFEKRYRGMSRVQVRRALDEEAERVRLPQIVMVNDAGAGEQPGITWRLFSASGFEGGIYSDANEIHWLIALINSKEALDVETLNRIDQRLESGSRTSRERSAQAGRTIRWYISKEGFSAVAAERLSSMRAFRSTYSQLDLIQDYLVKLSAGEAGARPASEFELVIPAEDEAELIAARTVEQIARAADFEQEAINQIKTALIEACLNAAEHGDSPDRRIYQRFSIEDDRLIITVSNKGKTVGAADGQSTPLIGVTPAATSRGRGLKIIRALMDEVRFERTDDGASLVMTKFLKRAKVED
ncbi:MAG TPA: ATP-binding protein [Blastocatellia bacterium]|jgi:serine/threonine-protein kinase RsbW